MSVNRLKRLYDEIYKTINKLNLEFMNNMLRMYQRK